MNNQRTKHYVWTWETIGACFCFTSGIGAGVVGSILSATAWILGSPQHPWLHGMGTALLIVTIPLLIFSGYCLDWAERDKTSASRSQEKARETLFTH